MPRTTLIDYTGAGRPDAERHAANLLAFTKAARLGLSPERLADVQALPQPAMEEELRYMATTIRSSWEFADVVFCIEGVTRATAQQITRTRTASYAMQSLRVVDARRIGITNPLPVGALRVGYAAAAWLARAAYAVLVRAGVPREDARGLLPLNTHCNLVVKYNLRSFADLLAARRSLRTQGEYASIVRDMERAVLTVWPWAEAFFSDPHAAAIAMLEEEARKLGPCTSPNSPTWNIAKAIDLLRTAK